MHCIEVRRWSSAQKKMLEKSAVCSYELFHMNIAYGMDI